MADAAADLPVTAHNANGGGAADGVADGGAAPAAAAQPAAAGAAAPAAAAPPPAEPFPTACPMLMVRDAKGALAFYERALNAEVKAKFDAPASGLIMHAYLRSPLGGGFAFCVEDEGALPELDKWQNVHAAKEAATTHASAVYIYVTLTAPGSCDEATERMREAGATVTMEPRTVFWGPRLAKCIDPYGVAWDFAETLPKDDPPPAAAEEQHSAEHNTSAPAAAKATTTTD
jgi:PhnB protein